MLAVLSIVGGFVMSLGMFVGGLVLATAILAVEPAQQPGPDENVAEVWTSEPRRVDVATQDFQRLAATAPSPAQSSGTEVHSADSITTADLPQPVDQMTTAALPAESEDTSIADGRVAALYAAHVDWCFGRYRSYDRADNTYRPFSGGRQLCVSPYLMEANDYAVASEEPVTFEENNRVDDGDFYVLVDDMPAGGLQIAFESSGAGADMSQNHVRNCFSRYRSYRAEDNSYQPYGGGPRRQCE